ncbi:class I/II aminotransferase [Candidatus Omnitrophus magneticus]|uniref:Aminotransferase n=1 Tax=Candidatus Omnitrophus magneticus TaxID=1609969 RepID=A0A0F0CSS0_9BACT|nr:class I/II aminotransferase [Candidatus Omnitrophus magneticus]
MFWDLKNKRGVAIIMSSIKIETAERLKKLPPYLFEEIDMAKQKALKEGRPIIDLGVGDPDSATPDFVVDKLALAARETQNQKYAFNKGLRVLREKMAEWYRKRFGVILDPDTEILPLLGSKEGIGHIPLAFVNHGDCVLVPDPGYPPYNSGAIFAGGEVHFMPLLEKNKFLPDLGAIKKEVLQRSKLIHLNYPNNPTGALATKEFYKDVISLSKKYNIIVSSDAAYSELSFDGNEPLSFLEIEGAKGVGIEFHSLSKTFNMTGWRVGMAVGNKDVLAGLGKVKANLDSGIFTAIQIASITALENADKVKKEMLKIYTERRDTFIKMLNNAGWKVPLPPATFYVWAPVFGKYDSTSLAKALLEKADIIATPGNGFGDAGEGYVRMALTVDTEKLKIAAERIKKAFFA